MKKQKQKDQLELEIPDYDAFFLHHNRKVFIHHDGDRIYIRNERREIMVEMEDDDNASYYWYH